MLDRLDVHARERGATNVTSIVADMRTLPFDDESFDVVVSCLDVSRADGGHHRGDARARLERRRSSPSGLLLREESLVIAPASRLSVRADRASCDTDQIRQLPWAQWANHRYVGSGRVR